MIINPYVAITFASIALTVELINLSEEYSYDWSEENAAILVGQAQQVHHASNLFIKFEGSAPTKIGDLTGSYIRSIPALPDGADGASWTIEKAKNRYNETVSIATVELPFVKKNQDGVTKNTCKAINNNSAGVVFCTVSKNGLFNDVMLTAGAGSADFVVDRIDDGSRVSKAKIHIII